MQASKIAVEHNFSRYLNIKTEQNRMLAHIKLKKLDAKLTKYKNDNTVD